MKTLTTPTSIEGNSRGWRRGVLHLFVPLVLLLGFLLLAPAASAQSVSFKNVGKGRINVRVYDAGDSAKFFAKWEWSLEKDEVAIWNRSDRSRFTIWILNVSGDPSLNSPSNFGCKRENVSGDVERIEVALPCAIDIVPKTVVRFCNENPDKVYVAYVYWLDQKKGWISNGWRTVEARKCEDVTLAYYEDYIYYYAADDGEGRWSGNTEFCVHWTAGFKLPNSDKSSCPEKNGYRRVGMTKLAVKRGITAQRLVP